MSMQAMARWLGGAKKVAPLLALLAATLAAVAALGVVASAASAETFSNNEGITINDGLCVSAGTATPYPSVIPVSGLEPSVTDVNVTVSGLSHQWPDDVGLLLVSPEGEGVILMTDSGGSDNTPASNITLTFDDAATTALPNNGPLTSATYRPTQGTVDDRSGCLAPVSFPAPAPASPYGTTLSVFNGSDPNGNWQLYVIDDSFDDAGSITGWSLDISTTTAEDTTPPTVTDTTPDGTVSRTAATVTATFSELVQNVSPETFFLERQIAAKAKTDPPKYVLVDATVDLSDDGLSAELTPVEDLPKGNYRATITTEVTDMADNALAAPVVWTFTVEK